MRFVLRVVPSMTVLKWTGSISLGWGWHEFRVIYLGFWLLWLQWVFGDGHFGVHCRAEFCNVEK